VCGAAFWVPSGAWWVVPGGWWLVVGVPSTLPYLMHGHAADRWQVGPPHGRARPIKRQLREGLEATCRGRNFMEHYYVFQNGKEVDCHI